MKKVKLLVKGGTPLGIFPGVVTAYPLSVAYLKTPNVTAPKPPRVTAPPVRNDVRSAQQRLADLGYLLPTDVDGQAGPATAAAVIAFQKWEGLGRDGKLGPVTNARLRTATRPKPITRGGAGRRIEILLDRQVALAIDNNRVVRVIHISSGAPATPTPTGNFAVYAKYGRWWSVPFREWLPWALPFHGGYALHELSEVPSYPASHGCARETNAQAPWMFNFARVGTPVKVIGVSR